MAVKATTPIGAGFAQAFDTSGLAQVMYEDRERKRARFEKNIKDFDPSTVWHRDIPEFTNKVNQYYEYISDNYDALSNKSRNLDKWQEMKSMENELQNFAVASKAMGQHVDKAQKLMMDKAEYDTPENQQLIDDIITGNRWGGLAQGYESGDAMNSSFMREFGKNMILDTESMTEALQEMGVHGETPEISRMQGRRMQSRRPIEFEEGALRGKIGEWWDKGFMTKSGNRVSAIDIQRKYDGDPQAFAEDVSRGLKKFTEWEEWNEPKESESGTRKPSQFDISIRPTEKTVTGTSTATQKQGGVNLPLFGQVGGKDVSSSVKYNYPTYSQGGVVVSGTQTAYRWNPGAGGFDMDGAQWSSTKLTSDGRMVLTNVDHGAISNQPITFSRLVVYDDQGNPTELKNHTIQKGQPLSPEMIKAVKAGQASVTDGDGMPQKISGMGGNRYIYSGRIAYSQSVPNKQGIDMGDPTSFYGALNQPGVRQIAMPWEDFKAQSTIPHGDIESIEAALNTYDIEPAFPELNTETQGNMDQRVTDFAKEFAARYAQSQQ